MNEAQKVALGYALGLVATAAQVGYSLWIGPQPKAEQPAPSLAVWLANQLGFWALAWLTATLACSPLRYWTGAKWPAVWRKRFGLTAFALACLHVTVWLVGEKRADLAAVGADFAEKPWLVFGLLTFLLLITLAVTTPIGVVKRLGGVRWQHVHRLIYPAGLLAILHYALRDDADAQHWIGFALLISLLLWARRYPPTLKMGRRH